MYLAGLLTELKQEAGFLKQNQNTESLFLDVGCGVGDLTKEISRVFNSKVIGINLNRHRIQSDKVDFMLADGCDLPFKPGTFVLVSAFSLIEHIKEDYRKKLYEEADRVMTNTGGFVIQLPNRYFPIEQHSFLPFVGYLPSKLHGAFYHSYVNVPSKRKIVKELTKNGFEIAAVIAYRMPVSRFYQILSRIVPFGFLIVAHKRL
jgi:SAM-dependent methyltransferase